MENNPFMFETTKQKRFKTIIIGLVSMVFTIKYRGFRLTFSLKPIQWDYDSYSTQQASVSPGRCRVDHLPMGCLSYLSLPCDDHQATNLTTYELLLTIWLVVSTPLKNISQLGWLFPIYGKIKNVPNHQPAIILWQFQSISPVFAGSLVHCSPVKMSPKNLEIRIDSSTSRINVTDVSRLLCCSEIRRKFWIWTNLWCKRMSLENGNYKLARGQRVRHTAGRLTDKQQVDVFPLALSLWSASDFETMILYTFVYERPSRATPKFLKTLKILRFASTPVRSFSRLSPASVCPDRRGRSLDNQPCLACGRISEISHTEKLKLIGLRTVWPAMGMPVFSRERLSAGFFQ